MKLVKEHIEFKRGVEPADAMGTSYRSQRDFRNFHEAAEWVEAFPEICTDDKIKNWKEHFRNGMIVYTHDPNIFIRVTIAKWIRDNLTIRGESLRLPEASKVFAILESYLREKFRQGEYDNIEESFNFKRGVEPSDAMGINPINEMRRRFNDLVDMVKDRVYSYEVRGGKLQFSIVSDRFTGSLQDYFEATGMDEYLVPNSRELIKGIFVIYTYKVKPEYYPILRQIFVEGINNKNTI